MTRTVKIEVEVESIAAALAAANAGADIVMLDNMSPEETVKSQGEQTAILSTMSYKELRDIYEYNPNAHGESALYQSRLTTQRSGQPGIGLSRSTGAESEPNNNKSSANAVSADTTLGYLTAYDEDW